MATYIAMPKLGMAMLDGTIVEWKVKEGEWVEAHQPVVTVETQKTTNDVEAEVAGFVHILVEVDNVVSVGRVMGLLAESEEELAALQKEPPREIYISAEREAEAVVSSATATPEEREAEAVALSATATPEEGGGKIRISPVARKMAQESAIDIIKVAGTGSGGKIVREDIEKAIAAKGTEVEAAQPEEAPCGKRVKETIPLTGMRKVIAEHLHRSLAVSAQLTAIGEIDMTEMIKLRKGLVAREEAIGARITYTDMFVFAVAKVLKDNPMVNSSLIDKEIKVWESINIGVAVALEGGLIVPVVKDADKKSLAEISKTIRELAEKARGGKLVPDEVMGGTFTLTNLGAAGAGWRFETAIINQPESAILGTGGITERAVVRDGQIMIRPIMTYSFTYDHRVVDGSLAVQFMARVIDLLENPSLLLV